MVWGNFVRLVNFLAVLVLSTGFLGIAQAETQNSSAATTTIETKGAVEEAKAAATSGDLDAEVEDSKLRANSGAKSRFSSSFNLTYSGSSLEKPFDDVRPNVDGSRLNAPVSLSGMVGLRFRFDKNTSIFGATGISKSRPFTSSDREDEWEANNIMVHVNSTFKYEDIQVSSTWLGYVWTQEYMKDVNQQVTAGYSLSALSQLGQSKFRGGIGGSFSYTHFDSERGLRYGFKNGKLTKVYADVQDLQTDFTMGVSPTLQYRFSDRFNAYTSLQLLNYSHSRDEENFKLEKLPISQNIGVGVAVLRDLYLAPNIDFRPEEMAAKKTSVNLSAIINL